MNSSVPQFRRDRIEAAKAAAAAASQNPPATDENQPGQQNPFETNQQHSDHQKDDNDAKAWKGRLAKTQEELRAEREASQRATVEALQAKEAARQAEERAKQAQEALAEAQSKLSVYSQREQENFLSEEEKKQLSDTFGEDATTLLAKVIGKVRQNTPAVDVNKTIDERMRELNTQTLEREWSTALRTRIPEAHILRADSDFIAFAQSKSDYFGNTALDVMDEIGAARDVNRVEFIEKLIADYKNSKGSGNQDPSNNPTVPPRTAPAVPSRPNQGGKTKVPSSEFLAVVHALKTSGNSKALRKYLAENEEVK